MARSGQTRRSQRLKNKRHTDHENAESDPEPQGQDLKPLEYIALEPESHQKEPENPSKSNDEDSINSGNGGEGGSEDEAPEDLSLAVGKQVSMETRRRELDHVKRINEAVKEKRRKKHELFKTQKINRTLARFPEEALEQVTLKIAEEKASKKAKKRLRQKLKARTESQGKSLPTEARHKTVTVVALEELGSSKFMGGTLTDDFRRQHFYGDRLKRLPVLSIQARKYKNRPAKNFTKSKS